MKSTFLRPAAALALALGLAACGGKAAFDVAGTVAGLTNDGLVLRNGNATVAVPAGADKFRFPNQIDYGTAYKVEVDTPPRHQNCTILSGSDTAGRLAAIAVTVTCAQNTHLLSGTVAGLTVGGLELTNGSLSGTVVVAKDATAFAFATRVADGATYGVAVLTAPTGLTCSVANGTGLMGETDVTNVAVTCAPNP